MQRVKKRATVEDVESFFGWEALDKIVYVGGSLRNQALVVVAFFTGGRITEALVP